jgi:anti-sigma factor RsiW
MISFLDRYLAGELSGAEQRTFKKHLEGCECCEAYLQKYRDTVAHERDACCCHDDSIPCDVPEGLVQAILKAREADSGSVAE